jgi:energy-coupling factor transporter transmembrane protein EcfT
MITSLRSYSSLSLRRWRSPAILTLGPWSRLAIYCYFLLHISFGSYRRDGSSLRCQLMEFLPISMLFFSLNYWETFNWAAPDLQNLSVILFSLLAIRVLSSGEEPPSPTRLLVVCSSGVLSALSVSQRILSCTDSAFHAFTTTRDRGFAYFVAVSCSPQALTCTTMFLIMSHFSDRIIPPSSQR